MIPNFSVDIFLFPLPSPSPPPPLPLPSLSPLPLPPAPPRDQQDITTELVELLQKAAENPPPKMTVTVSYHNCQISSTRDIPLTCTR